MREWKIKRHIVGTICDVKGVKELKHEKTLPGRTVKRFGDDVNVSGVNASGFFSVFCLILAFKKMRIEEMRQLLMFNEKTLPSLVYISFNHQVCVLSSGVYMHAMPSLNSRTRLLCSAQTCR